MKGLFVYERAFDDIIPNLKSGQFQFPRIIDIDAHADVIYLLLRRSSLYIVRRGLLFITWKWAVQSLRLGNTQ